MTETISIPTVIVGEKEAGQAAAVLKALEQLVNSVVKSNFDIGSLAHEIKKNGYYTNEYTTFQDYAKTLSIKPRKLQYLRRIAEVCEAVGFERETYELIGVAKLREITSLDYESNWTNPDTLEVTPMRDFILGLLERGLELSVEEVKEHVRVLKGRVGANDLVWRNFRLLRGVAENVVDPAIALAKKQIGSVSKTDEGVSVDASDGAALEVVAVAFLNDPSNGEFVME